MNDPIRIEWQGVEDATVETLLLRFLPKEIIAESSIRGTAEGWSLDLNYTLIMEPDWTWKTFSLRERGKTVCTLERHSPALPKVDFIDFCLTPFTNTLPIRQLQLSVHEQARIDVLYLCYPYSEPRLEAQEYRRIGENVYHFRQLSTAFEASIEVDAHGIVTEYPGLFRRLV